MPIPVVQLERWTHQGGTTASSNAYAAIDCALIAPGSGLRGHSFEIFLQGSYRNDTNIRADSDIDVVVALNETSINDSSELAPIDRILFPARQPPVYPIESFRRDVVAALRTAFGILRVREGSRAIHVNTGHGREADVIPAIRYYRHYRNALLPQLLHHEGIALLSGTQWIYNFPIQHIQNGQAKNAAGRAGGRYKPTVRMFKNARNKAVERGVVADGDAPSYFIEGLLSNVPDNLFTNDPSATFVGIYEHLHPRQGGTLISQNGIIPLIGATTTQWQLAAAQQFMAGLRRLWNEWT